MRFSNKLAKTFAEEVTQKFFEVFYLDDTNRGINFTWEGFKERMLPNHLKGQLFLSIGNNKNWKKYLPLLLEFGNSKCEELYKSSNIEI